MLGKTVVLGLLASSLLGAQALRGGRSGASQESEPEATAEHAMSSGV
jgi:hypothetical protein